MAKFFTVLALAILLTMTSAIPVSVKTVDTECTLGIGRSVSCEEFRRMCDDNNPGFSLISECVHCLEKHS